MSDPAIRQRALAQLRADLIDWRYKSFPPAEGVTPANIAERGWNVLRRDLFLPALVLRESALVHNIELMRRWCAEHGVSISPHGKTTMSPELYVRQFAAGAWAMTVATPSQMRVCRAFGIDRIVLANELIEPGSVRWLADELAADADFEAYCLVDSEAAVAAMNAALEGRPLARRINVLIELGVNGGRTGARDSETAIAVVAAVLASPSLRLAGVECYEGVLTDWQAIDVFLGRLRTLLLELAGRGVFEGLDELVVTAGGSEAFDRVVEILSDAEVRIPVRLVLRSGCYITHDHGAYDERSPLGSHRDLYDDQLEPALESWAVVLSRPEPGLMLVGMGKRDVPFDDGYPVPLRLYTAEGMREVRGEMLVTNLNDQHAFVTLDPSDTAAVGDLLCCGISHPCTAFDKWRLIPIVDDDYNVIDAVHTFF